MGLEGMEIPNPFKYDQDVRSYEGWQHLPATLLRNMMVFPAFGDIMRATAVRWEFSPKEDPKDKGLSQFAALVGAAVAKELT